MSYFFKKKHRLLKKKDFQRVFDGKNRLLGKYLKMYYREGELPKIGIVASSAFGKAHIRNRFKRHIREAFRHAKQSPIEMIIVPTPLAKNVSYQDLYSELTLLIQNANKRFLSYQKKLSV